MQQELVGHYRNTVDDQAASNTERVGARGTQADAIHG